MLDTKVHELEKHDNTKLFMNYHNPATEQHSITIHVRRPPDYYTNSMLAGSSIYFFSRTKKVTASLPSKIL